MDKNNNQECKSGCEVTNKGKKGNFHSGCTCTDKHVLPDSFNQSFIHTKDSDRVVCDGEGCDASSKADISDFVADIEMKIELCKPNSDGITVDKEETDRNNLKERKRVMFDPSQCEDKGLRELSSGMRLVSEVNAHVANVTDFGIAKRQEFGQHMMKDNNVKMQKLLKKESVQKMIESNNNIKDNFVEHMVDLADQAVKDNWIDIGSAEIYSDRNQTLDETSEINGVDIHEKGRNSTSQNHTLNGENVEVGKPLEDIISRKKNYFRAKSQSSNTLICKPKEKDVMVTKVKVEKSAQIIEARPKSHHFLW